MLVTECINLGEREIAPWGELITLELTAVVITLLPDMGERTVRFRTTYGIVAALDA